MARYLIIYSNNIKLITDSGESSILDYALSFADTYGKLYKIKLKILNIIKG
jgi:hypothetical protein